MQRKKRKQRRFKYLEILQDFSDLSCTAGLEDFFFLLVHAVLHLFEPVLQIREKLHRWLCCQETLKGEKIIKKAGRFTLHDIYS